MKAKVLLTHNLTEGVMKRLRDLFDLTVACADGDSLEREKLFELSKGKDAVISLLSDKIDESFFQACPSVKVIANYAVGYDNIDISSANKYGVFVTNTPGVLTDATADIAFALLLAVARRIHEGEILARSGNWGGWAPKTLLGVDTRGKTLGIVGFGRIGQAVAMRGEGFGMNILYNSRSRKIDAETAFKNGAEYVPDLDDLLKRSDFVSVSVAYVPSATHHLLGRQQFALMKKTSVLVNTARGAVLDEKSLAEALERGVIFGAGLDVYEREPKINPKLFDLPNCVLLPHLGSSTIETLEKMGELVIQNIQAVLNGETPKNLVSEVKR